MALHFRRLSTRVFCSTLCVFRLLCSQANTETFQYGEFCIALDKKQRKFLFKLKEGEKFSRSTGYIKHSDVVGLLPGSKIKDHRGSVAYLFRPTLEEYVLLMKRGPTPTYPKDVHAMMSMMDISPGCHVIEGGSGSGAMTLFLSRAGDFLVVGCGQAPV
jgi:tRNA (adenine57-N1/adenine58-N1)-methyltransferase